MIILAIEASNKVCSVAVVQEEEFLAHSELFLDKRASGMLVPMIENVLAMAGIQKTELNAVAVGKGPGSYTGLRVAVSTAKGYCMALDIPLIAINSLHAMAFIAKKYFPKATLFCPMIDARRLEVYTGIYDSVLTEKLPTEAVILKNDTFSDYENLVVFGDGAAKFKDLQPLAEGIYFATFDIHPSAQAVGLLAGEQFKKQQFENLVTFEPFYLKEFIGLQNQQ